MTHADFTAYMRRVLISKHGSIRRFCAEKEMNYSHFIRFLNGTRISAGTIKPALMEMGVIEPDDNFPLSQCDTGQFLYILENANLIRQTAIRLGINLT